MVGGWSGCCECGINKVVLYSGGAEYGFRAGEADETTYEEKGGEDVLDTYISAVVTQTPGSPIFECHENPKKQTLC